MRLLIFTILALSLIAGCSTVEKVAEKVADNKVVVHIAVRQGVYRFIDASENEQEKLYRESRVCSLASTLGDYVADNAVFTAGNLMGVVRSHIDMTRYSRADRALITEALLFVQMSLEKKIEDQELSDDAVIALTELIDSVKTISCTENYVVLRNNRGVGIKNPRGYIHGEIEILRNITTKA